MEGPQSMRKPHEDLPGAPRRHREKHVPAKAEMIFRFRENDTQTTEPEPVRFNRTGSGDHDDFGLNQSKIMNSELFL